MIFENGAAEIHTLAVDWVTNNVYFTEGSHGWVAVQSANAGQENRYKILFSKDLYNPRGIAVDPVEGWVFRFLISL